MSNHIRYAEFVEGSMNIASSGNDKTISFSVNKDYGICTIIHVIVSTFKSDGSLFSIIGGLQVRNGYGGTNVAITATGNTSNSAVTIKGSEVYSGRGIIVTITNASVITSASLLKCILYD